MVAHFKRLHLGADLPDHAGDLVAEGHADPGIGNGAVIQVQIGTADARPRHAHDGILRMQNFRYRLMVNADPFGAAKIHGKHQVIPFLF